MKKFAYIVEAMVYGAKHKLTINNIPFSTSLSGEPVNADIPINEFLTDTSILGIELMPLNAQTTLQKNAEIKLTIKQFTYPVIDDRFITLVEHISEPGSLDGYENYTFGEPFSSPLEYDTPIWNENKVLDIANKKQLAQLTHYSEHIWHLFNAKNIEGILSIFDKKFGEYEKRYFWDRGRGMTITMKKLEKVLNDNNYLLVKYDLSWFKPELCANGKLITLLDSEGYSFIMFYNYDKRELVEFPIYFGINKLGEAEISL